MLDGLERLTLVIALGRNRDPRAVGRGQKEDAQDTLGVDLLVAFAHLHIGAESCRGMNELGRRTGVQAELVFDLDFFGNHGRPPVCGSFDMRSEATRIDFDPLSRITWAKAARSLQL